MQYIILHYPLSTMLTSTVSTIQKTEVEKFTNVYATSKQELSIFCETLAVYTFAQWAAGQLDSFHMV